MKKMITLRWGIFLLIDGLVIGILIGIYATQVYGAETVEIQTKDGKVYEQMELLSDGDLEVPALSDEYPTFEPLGFTVTGELNPAYIWFGDSALTLQDVITALEKANRWLVKSSEYNGPMISADQERRRNEDIDYIRDITYRLKRVFE
jgi:hypothetical protein